MSALLFSQASFAQMSMTRSTFNAVYTPVSGGATAIIGGTLTDQFSTTASVSNVDDAAAHIVMPFNFVYEGMTFTGGVNHIGINTNGFAYLFNGTNTNSAKVTTASNLLSSTVSPVSTARILAPWWDDMIANTPVNGITGTVKYEVTGSTPDRVLTVEWGNYPAYWQNTPKAINFQLKLYENGHSTKSNVIEFWYGSVDNIGTTPNQFHASESASIGIKNALGGTNNYIDAITGSSRLANGMMNTHQFPRVNFRFTPGAPSAIAGGTYTVGSGGTYPSLSLAVADVNHRGISGPITLSLTDAVYDTSVAGGSNIFPILLSVVAGNNSSNTITIQPASGTSTLRYRGTTSTTGSVINDALGTATSNTTEPIFGLVGTDYVTLSNVNLEQATGAGTNVAGVRRGLLVVNASASNGAQFNTFQNISITLSKSSVSTAIMAIQQNVVTTPTSSAGSNNNNRYLDLNITRAAKGIELLGNSSFPDLNCEIGNTNPMAFNTIGSATDSIGGFASVTTQGIRAASQSGVMIYNNHVRNVISTTATIDGIFLDVGQGICSIYNNKIDGVRNFGTTSTSVATGLRVNLATTGAHESRVYNNFISGVTHGFTGTATATRYVRGIHLQSNGSGASSIHRLDFNSVRIATNSGYTGSSACIEIGTTTGTVMLIRNNIFADFSPAQSGVARHVAWQSTSNTLMGSSGSLSDYNDLYVANTANGFIGAGSSLTFATLADWQAAMAGQNADLNSYNVDPSFVSASDLHAGNPILDGVADPSYSSNSPWVTTDIDNEARGGSTDIGADEFTLSSLDMGAIARVSPAAGGCFSASQPVIATIRNFAGTDIDFSANNVTVTAQITGAVSQTLSITLTDNSLNPGGLPLAAGTSMNVTIGNLNMTTIGVYNFNIYTTVSGDGDGSNDAVSPAPTSNVVATVGGNSNAVPASICATGSTTLTLSGHSVGSSIQWKESSTSGGPYTNIPSATTNPYVVPSVTGTTYYIAEVTCNGATNSTETTVVYSNPALSGTSGNTRCGAGTVDLSASTSEAGIFWYDAPTGGNLLGSGSSFTTPVITTTTDFYAAAHSAPLAKYDSLGAGALTSSTQGNSLFNGTYGGQKSQYIIRASELQALGFSAGIFSSLGVNVSSTTSGSYTGFSISMAHTGLNEFPTAMDMQGGLTEVYSVPSQTISTGLNTFNFNVTNFSWNGTSNIIISTCWSNNASSATSQTMRYDNTTYRSAQSYRVDNQLSGAVCGLVGTSGLGGTQNLTNGTSVRPKFYLNGQNICIGTRTAVTATVSTPPSIVASATNTTVCAGDASDLSVSSSNGSYTYSWTSNPAGFSATGPGPHTVNPTSTTIYTVIGEDNDSGSPFFGCADLSTVTVTVNPLPLAVPILPVSATAICNGSDVTLSTVLSGSGTIGTATGTQCCAGSPYRGFYDASKLQFLLTPTELTNAGIPAGIPIVSLTFDVSSGTSSPLSNFTISMANVSSTSLSTGFITSGLQQVLNPVTYTATPGLNQHNFNNSFVWNGTSHVLVDICFAGVSTTSATVRTFTVPSGQVRETKEDNNLNFCSTFTPTASLPTTKPVVVLGYLSNQVADWTASPSGSGLPGSTIGESSIVVNPTVTTTYTATFTNGFGCTSSSTKVVTVIDLPVVYNITGTSGAICQGAAGIAIGLDGSENGYLYQLVLNGTTNVGLPVTGDGNPISFGSHNIAGTYTVVASSNSSPVCSNNMSGSVSVSIHPQPVLSCSVANHVSCNGGSDGAANVSASGGTAPYTITGDPLSGLSAGTYTYMVTDANGCTATCTVTITEPSVLTASANPGTILCFGGSANVDINASGGTAPYSGTGTFSQSAGTVVYTVSDANGCVATVSVNLSEPSKVEGSISHVNSICGFSNGQATVTPSGGTGPYTYMWSDGQTTQTATGLGAGNYTVTITDANGCVGSASVTILGVGGEPDPAGAISGPAGACRNQTGVVYSIAPVSGATSYIWTLPTGASGSSSGTSITLSFSNAYFGGFICVTPVNGCGQGIQSCMFVPVLTVRPSQPGFIIGNPNPCGPSILTYSIPVSNNALSYTWSVTGSGLTILSGQGSNSVQVSIPNGFGQGTISVFASNCIGNTSTRTLALTGIPSHSNNLVGPGYVCANTSGVAYSIGAVNGAGTSYVWTTTGDMNVVSGNGTPACVVNFGPSFTSGTLNVTTSSSCGSFTRSFTIRSTPIQPGSITGPGSNLCFQTGVTYSISAVAGATGYSWTVPAGVNITANTGLSITVDFTPSFTGTGNICVSAVNACGSSTARCYSVTAAPAIPAVPSGPTNVCKSQSAVVYTATAVPGATNYQWSISGGAAIAPAGLTATVNYTYATSTLAVITMNAENACGLSQPAKKNVSVDLGCRINQSMESAGIMAYPNPAYNKTTVTFDADSKSTYLMKITDLLGQKIQSQTLEAERGNNSYELDLENMAPGLYLLSVESSDGAQRIIRLVIE